MKADIITTLYKYYNIQTISIEQITGGWSALAYLIKSSDKRMFLLKVYEKSRASTSKLTSTIDVYMPIVGWLNLNTTLCNKIINPLKTIQGEYHCEDRRYIYLLSDYIQGYALTDNVFEENQIIQLADIISQLHHHGEDIPLPVNNIREDFEISFYDSLLATINQQKQLEDDLKQIIVPYISCITKSSERLINIAEKLKLTAIKFVLCHTDIHGGNIIQATDNIFLIDWEGLKLAPAEADLFSLTERSWFKLFYDRYKSIHTEFEINQTILQFYQQKRIIEDIWEFIEQLQNDKMNPENRSKSLYYLQRECERLSGSDTPYSNFKL